MKVNSVTLTVTINLQQRNESTALQIQNNDIDLCDLDIKHDTQMPVQPYDFEMLKMNQNDFIGTRKGNRWYGFW